MTALFQTRFQLTDPDLSMKEIKRQVLEAGWQELFAREYSPLASANPDVQIDHERRQGVFSIPVKIPAGATLGAWIPNLTNPQKEGRS